MISKKPLRRPKSTTDHRLIKSVLDLVLGQIVLDGIQDYWRPADGSISDLGGVDFLIGKWSDLVCARRTYFHNFEKY